MSICLSHAGTATYKSESPSTRLLVGTANGVSVIERESSREWRVAEKSLDGCHISTLFVEPASGLLFAGVYKKGLFASADSGKSWEQRDQGLDEKDVYCINAACAEHGVVRLYVGTQPARLFESDDLGATWRELTALAAIPSAAEWTFPAPPHHAHVKNIAVDPRNPEIIYAGVEVGGLFKSADGGRSWRELRGFYADVHRLAIRPSTPDCIYLCTGDGLYRSGDGGENWEHLTTNAMRIAYPDPCLFILRMKTCFLWRARSARRGLGGRPIRPTRGSRAVGTADRVGRSSVMDCPNTCVATSKHSQWKFAMARRHYSLEPRTETCSTVRTRASTGAGSRATCRLFANGAISATSANRNEHE